MERKSFFRVKLLRLPWWRHPSPKPSQLVSPRSMISNLSQFSDMNRRYQNPIKGGHHQIRYGIKVGAIDSKWIARRCRHLYSSISPPSGNSSAIFRELPNIRVSRFKSLQSSHESKFQVRGEFIVDPIESSEALIYFQPINFGCDIEMAISCSVLMAIPSLN